MDGLVALVEMSVSDDLREGAELLRLVARRERQVRIVPVAMDAETLEVDTLHLDLREREIPARLAEGTRVERLGRAPHGLLDLVLDRQAVAIPARQVRRIVTVEGARLDDDVLQHLVDRVADVDRAVRVRRAVVQDEHRPAPRDLAQLSIGVLRDPPLEHRGLAARQVGLHREVRRRQVDGRFVVGHGRGAKRRAGKCSDKSARS